MNAPRAGVALALELSSSPGSIAARRAGREVQRTLAASRAHAADLLAAVSGALDELQAHPQDLEALVVGLGPGSFTALRVALATALGLGRGTGARLRGVASFEALARAELAPGERGAVVLDARAGELYVAIYERRAGELVEHVAPRIARAPALAALLSDVDVLLADDDACAAAVLERRDFRRARSARPQAREVLELGLEQLARVGAHAPSAIEPLYLRPFAATRRGA